MTCREREHKKLRIWGCHNSAPLCVNRRRQKNVNIKIEQGNRRSLTWEHKHSKHPCQDDETYRVVHASWAVLILICLFYRRSFCIFQKKRAAHFAFFLSLPFSWMSVWIAFHSHFNAGCVEGALNPVQVVVGGSHTERGWLLMQNLISLSPHTTAHRGTSTLQDWGEGSRCSTGIGWSFCQSPLNSPSSVFFGGGGVWNLLNFGWIESSSLLSILPFLLPLTELEQDLKR